MSAPLVVDVTSVSTARELHAVLARHLAFPGYYGHNWDAFWDCINDAGQSSMPNTLELVGLSALAARLPREAARLVQSLSQYQRQRPSFRFLGAQPTVQPDGPASGGSAR